METSLPSNRTVHHLTISNKYMRSVASFYTLVMLLFVFSSSIAISGWFSAPKDYDECILESMKGVTSDQAARMIRNSCRKKFPVEQLPTEQLPLQAVQNIEGKGTITKDSITNKPEFKGTIYNGNPEWSIVSFVVKISDENTGRSRDYTTTPSVGWMPVEAKPLETQAFEFDILEEPLKWTWYISEAQGYKVK